MREIEELLELNVSYEPQKVDFRECTFRGTGKRQDVYAQSSSINIP